MRCNPAVLVLTALIAAVVSTCSSRASAHGVDPIGVAIVEHAGGAVRVRIDRPGSLAGTPLTVSVDAGCAPTGQRVQSLSPGRANDEHSLLCERALSGARIHIAGLDSAGVDAVLRVELADGAVHRSVMTAAAPELTLPARASVVTTLLAYLAMGAHHLLVGFDHLLFLVGTLLLERRLRRVALALTGFTVGHSATLGAAALGLVHVPSAWAEVGIALSLVWIAIAVARSDEAEPRGSASLWAALVVGLVHGLGFADALGRAGALRTELPLALFGFNLGIELGQLALVAMVLAASALPVRVPRVLASRYLFAHAIGALAVMWCIERALAV
ncbi:MAG: HupE/UreJ family protein [Myxococcales bacterium]|nr:HupE/UreJ family protein [Myxococcales bacterium]